MQCSCCGQQRENLREYSRSGYDANNRKTILTLQLCVACGILYRIKPRFVTERLVAASAAPALRVA